MIESAAKTVNVALLRDVLEFLTANPKVHDQGQWLKYTFEAGATTSPADDLPKNDEPAARLELTCKTAGCLAGWTAVAAGYAPSWPTRSTTYRQTGGEYTTEFVTPIKRTYSIPTTVDDYAGYYHDVDDDLDPLYVVDAVAREVLGLTVHQAETLFSPDNTLRDLWEFAVVLSGDTLTVPESLHDAPTEFDDHESRLNDDGEDDDE